VAVGVRTAGTGIGRGDYPAATAKEEAGEQQASNCCEAEMRENDGLLAAGDLTVVVVATLLHGPAVSDSDSELIPSPRHPRCGLPTPELLVPIVKSRKRAVRPRS
jgi:hypothetical protein